MIDFFRPAVGILILSLVLAGAGCRTPPVTEETDAKGLSAGARMNRIKETYKSPDCFLSNVKLDVVTAAGASQSAKGAIRADNTKNRMHMAFMDPYFGITVTELTVTPEKVYISGIREKTRSIPTDRFQVRGMGNNAIALPFSLFQDLLYGRLPEPVYKSPARINKETDVLTVIVKTPDEESQYEFKGDRLVRLVYTTTESKARIEVELQGGQPGTQFPETMAIRSGEATGPADTMNIRFTGIDLDAKCADSLFPMRM